MRPSYRDGAPPEAPVPTHRQKPEQHDGYLLIPSREATNLKTRPSYRDGAHAENRSAWQTGNSRSSTTVTSDSCREKRHIEKRDRRIPVLPELPKLVKRVRLPSVALDLKIGCAQILCFNCKNAEAACLSRTAQRFFRTCAFFCPSLNSDHVYCIIMKYSCTWP